MPDRTRWWEGWLPRRTKSLATAAQALQVGAPPPKLPKPGTNGEYGVAGTAIYGGIIDGEEYNNDLKGEKGMAVFDKMRQSDAQVRATLQAVKLPLISAVWEAVPPDGGDAVDQQIADFVHASIFDDDAMDDSWNSVLKHILLQLDFGFSVCERVWRVDEEGYYRLKRMAPRLPKTIKYWIPNRDGTVKALWQYAPEILDSSIPSPSRNQNDPWGSNVTARPNMAPPVPPATSWRYIAIPGEVLSIFTYDREGDNFAGRSALRAAYKHYWYKDLIYHLDGIRLDRWGVGIPTAELSEEASLSPEDLDQLAAVLKDLRANERVYLVAPVGVKYRILGPEAGGGASVSALPMVDHHDAMIARNVLAGFMTMGSDKHGTLGFGTRMADMFMSSLYGIASGICGDLKKSVVKEICDLNFDMTRRQYPTVKVRDLESQDIERIANVALSLANGGVITPDDDLEQSLRKTLRMPPLPKELTRAFKAEANQQQQEANADAAVTGQPAPVIPGSSHPPHVPPPPGDPKSAKPAKNLSEELGPVLQALADRPAPIINLTLPDREGRTKKTVTTAVERDDRGLVAKKTDTIIEEPMNEE
jgi:hypothetical protein